VALRCVAELAAAAGPAGMAGGQQDDLRMEELPRVEASLERIHRRKTGALLAVSLKMGGIVAGATARELEELWAFGQDIGLAFQITDDLLDVTGSAEVLGKQTQKDSERGKLTYPALFGVDGSREKAESLIRRAAERLEPFGARADLLRGLAQFVLERQQ
jgi:geranylgeranyl pyrophosphate synthase